MRARERRRCQRASQCMAGAVLALLLAAGAAAAGASTAGRTLAAEPTISARGPQRVVAPALVRIRINVGNRGTAPYRATLQLTLPTGLTFDERPATHPAVVRARGVLTAARSAHRRAPTPRSYQRLADAQQALRLAQFGSSIPLDVDAGRADAQLLNRPPRRTASYFFRLRAATGLARRNRILVGLAAPDGAPLITLPLEIRVEAPTS